MGKGHADSSATDAANRQLDETNRERMLLRKENYDKVMARLGASSGNAFAPTPGAPESRPNGFNPAGDSVGQVLDSMAAPTSNSFAAQDAASAAV